MIAEVLEIGTHWSDLQVTITKIKVAGDPTFDGGAWAAIYNNDYEIIMRR